MFFQVLVYVLTALAAVVVVLTRLRLGKGGAAGRAEVGAALLTLHTVAGVLALVVWLIYLIAEDGSALGELAGIAAVGLWWVTAVAGLLILVRWLPSRGRHATDARGDTWSQGPGLSILAHVGMLVGVLIFTYAYAKALV